MSPAQVGELDADAITAALVRDRARVLLAEVEAIVRGLLSPARDAGRDPGLLGQ